MTVDNIVKHVNELLAGELLTYNELELYLDQTIDEINSALDAKFPTFSELDLGTIEYNVFPDKYIRTVLCVGAAYKWLTMDEEGIQTAQQFHYDFNDALFRMVRDYLNQVPEEYKADSQASVVGLSDIAYINKTCRGRSYLDVGDYEL